MFSKPLLIHNGSKLQSYLNISANDVNVGDDVIINIYIERNISDYVITTETATDATGTVSIYLNDDTTYIFTVSISNGHGTLNISGLVAGVYVAHGEYSGDSKYKASSGTSESFIVRAEPIVVV